MHNTTKLGKPDLRSLLETIKSMSKETKFVWTVGRSWM